MSTQRQTRHCSGKCGLFSRPDWCKLCGSAEWVTSVRLPYACKLLFQEMQSMNVAQPYFYFYIDIFKKTSALPGHYDIWWRRVPIRYDLFKAGHVGRCVMLSYLLWWWNRIKIDKRHIKTRSNTSEPQMMLTQGGMQAATCWALSQCHYVKQRTQLCYAFGILWEQVTKTSKHHKTWHNGEQASSWQADRYGYSLFFHADGKEIGHRLCDFMEAIPKPAVPAWVFGGCVNSGGTGSRSRRCLHSIAGWKMVNLQG